MCIKPTSVFAIDCFAIQYTISAEIHKRNYRLVCVSANALAIPATY